MSDDPKPTIHIASCRSDGRCPECGRDWTERGVLSRLPVPPCGCQCCPNCEREHTRALLTEAIRQRDEHYFKGIKDVRMIRCMAHHKVPAFNSMEANGGECAVCVVDDIGKARDATIREVEQWKGKAIRVSGEADALERERDEAQAKLVEEREAMASISGELVQAQVKVAKERDEARAEVKTLRLLVESQTEQISHSAMDLYAAVQAEVKAEQRAERAEALLREVQQPIINVAVAAKEYGDREASREWYALLAKIREFTR